MDTIPSYTKMIRAKANIPTHVSIALAHARTLAHTHTRAQTHII